MSTEIKNGGSMENFRFFGIRFLILLVLSSKHIILYNEETLVVICFILFIYTCQKMMGDSIESSLNERSQAIASELRNFLTLKQQLVQELIVEHKKQLGVKSFIKTLGVFSGKKISQIARKREGALQALFFNQLQKKLKNLASYGPAGPMTRKLQNAISVSFRGAMVEKYNRSKKALKPLFLRQAVTSLKRDSKKRAVTAGKIDSKKLAGTAGKIDSKKRAGTSSKIDSKK